MKDCAREFVDAAKAVFSAHSKTGDNKLTHSYNRSYPIKMSVAPKKNRGATTIAMRRPTPVANMTI
jgi:hypothetical protein